VPAHLLNRTATLDIKSSFERLRLRCVVRKPGGTKNFAYFMSNSDVLAPFEIFFI